MSKEFVGYNNKLDSPQNLSKPFSSNIYKNTIDNNFNTNSSL
jgi:hypothetical protein